MEITEEKLITLINAAQDCGLKEIMSGKTTTFGMALQNYAATTYTDGALVYKGDPTEPTVEEYGTLLRLHDFQFHLK